MPLFSFVLAAGASEGKRPVPDKTFYGRAQTMKKLVCLVLALVMMASMCLAASAEDWKFERKIDIV